jgi:hypothetical protein
MRMTCVVLVETKAVLTMTPTMMLLVLPPAPLTRLLPYRRPFRLYLSFLASRV